MADETKLVKRKDIKDLSSQAIADLKYDQPDNVKGLVKREEKGKKVYMPYFTVAADRHALPHLSVVSVIG